MGVHPAAGGDKPDDRRRLTVAGNTFPDGFLWGTSSAAHQVEGDNRNCEWWEFEQESTSRRSSVARANPMTGRARRRLGPIAR